MAKRKHEISLIVALWSLGCGGQDPILDRAEEIRGQGGPEATRNSGPSAGGVRPSSSSSPAPGSVGVGVPDEPPPGSPDEPPPGSPDQPLPGSADESSRQPPPVQGEGAEATLSGMIVVPDGMSGTINLKAFVSQPMDGQGHPNLAGPDVKITAEGVSTRFEMTVKNGDQPIWLEAHLDMGELDGRPGPGEPFGRGHQGIPTTQDTAGLELKLEVRAHQEPSGTSSQSKP